MGKRKNEEKPLPIGFTRRSNGKLEYRFFVEGKRFSVYGATQKECKQKETEKREQLKNGIYKSSKSLTVQEWLLRWLDRREKKVKSQTIRVYRKLINRMCKQRIDEVGSTFGEIKLVKLEADNIRDMQNMILKDVKTRTANDCISLLKKALTAAVDDRILPYNPASGVERVKRTEVQVRDTIHRALSSSEVDSFFQAAENSWYYWLYEFLLNTGLRIGEASALTVTDIKDGTISINKTVARTEIGYEISKQAKTEAGTRIVPLLPEAWNAVNQQSRINRIVFRKENSSKPIFRLPKGGIIRPDRVNDDIKHICDEAGIERFSCHAFRATFTSRCVQQGKIPVVELMKILGHKDVQMTLGLYAHSDNEQIREHLLAVNFR